MRNEKDYIQWLMTIPGIGYIRCQNLLAWFGSGEAIWEASYNELLQVSSITPRIADAIIQSKPIYSFQEQERFLFHHKIRVLHKSDPEYPPLLLQIHDPPHILYIKGDFTENDMKTIGVVGSRKASSYGVLVTRKLCTEMAAAGITIVSGLAQGIDTIAHEAALHAGGRTIAVVAGGLEKIYPAENYSLADSITRHGVLISEFHPLTSARPGMFPIRNRIISGLSRGVLVTEAARKSGSLITADLALEHNRDVFAVPGPITSPSSQGTNRLIQQGAKMITGIEDLWEEYPEWQSNRCGKEAGSYIQMTEQERNLLEIIGYGGVYIDQLVRASQGAKGEIHHLLFEMEVKGLIKQMPGQMYMRCDV